MKTNYELYTEIIKERGYSNIMGIYYKEQLEKEKLHLSKK